MARFTGKLTDEQRAFVVTSLACFDALHVVVAGLKREFGVEVTAQAVEAYDPAKRAGRNLAPKWRTVFEETRRAFLDDTATIGISHKAVRLRMLHRMADRAEQQGNLALAGQFLEQAAKETGGAFTNKHELKSDGTLNITLKRYSGY